MVGRNGALLSSTAIDAPASVPTALARPCGGCVHIDQRNPRDIFCRRYPPAVVPFGKGQFKQFFPSVSPTNDTCGEFQMSQVYGQT